MTQAHPEAEFATWTDITKDEQGRDYRHAFYLAGMRGTVQFVFLRYEIDGVERELASDLGFHSPRPLYDGQAAMSLPGECHVFRAPHKQATCYYDGSSSRAEHVLHALKHEGVEAVWLTLRDYYFQTFYDGSYEQEFTPTPYRTQAEIRADMMQGMREMLEALPDSDPGGRMQDLIDTYDREQTEGVPE